MTVSADFAAYVVDQLSQPLMRDRTGYSMNYFAVPPEVLEDAADLASWARKSIAVARAAAAPKSHARRRQNSS